MNTPPILVEVIGPPGADHTSGIGRTLQNLLRSASNRPAIQFIRAEQVLLPFANRVTPLRQLPIAVRRHQPGVIVHFTQIVGCAQLLWHPVHPTIVTVHDLGVLLCPEDAAMFNPIERALLELQYRGMRNADHFLCVSHFTARSLISNFRVSPSRVHVEYHYVDRSIFRPIDGAREALQGRFGLEFEPGVLQLIYVGSELPRKNLTTLFQAMALLRERGIRSRLLKVGDPGGPRWRTKTLTAASQAGLKIGYDVLLLGRIDDKELPHLLSAADVFVMPSVMEGFGLPIAEAMACGVPIACSDAAALPEVAGGAAALFNPRDPVNIAEGLARLHADPLLRAGLRERGLERVTAINREAAAGLLLSLYEQLASQPNQRTAIQGPAS